MLGVSGMPLQVPLTVPLTSEDGLVKLKSLILKSLTVPLKCPPLMSAVKWLPQKVPPL